MSASAGMTKEQLIATLGPPLASTFKDDAEAIQYCTKGMVRDTYTVMWLRDGRLSAMTTSTGLPQISSCDNPPTIDWGQAPPDVRIAIENR